MCKITLDKLLRVLYLWHPNTENIFSGFGIGKDKKNIVGMLMIDRPKRAPNEYLKEIKNAFGKYQLYPMTINPDRGILCQMDIKNNSKQYLRELELPIDNNIKKRFLPIFRNKPKPHFQMHYSHKHHLWLSRFYIPNKRR